MRSSLSWVGMSSQYLADKNIAISLFPVTLVTDSLGFTEHRRTKSFLHDNKQTIGVLNSQYPMLPRSGVRLLSSRDMLEQLYHPFVTIFLVLRVSERRTKRGNGHEALYPFHNHFWNSFEGVKRTPSKEFYK